jgi:hypothetical protein
MMFGPVCCSLARANAFNVHGSQRSSLSRNATYRLVLRELQDYAQRQGRDWPALPLTPYYPDPPSELEFYLLTHRR